MPDIGMADLISPIQAGANIVAQANNIRRQREQMALQWQQQQARIQELQQLGQVRQLEAQKAQQELSNEKEKKAARILFGESYNKAYSEFVKTKPESTESERSEYALRSALPNAHPDDIPDIIKSVSASAMAQDKNAIAMQKAIGQMEANARLNEVRIEGLNARIEHFQKMAEQAQRTLEERETFHNATIALQTQKQQAEKERDQSKEAADFVKSQATAGQKAYDAVIRQGGKTALLDANTARLRTMREFGEKWSAEHGYKTSPPQQSTPTTKAPAVSPDNADAETSPTDQPTLAPEAKDKLFKFDKAKGMMVPVE